LPHISFCDGLFAAVLVMKKEEKVFFMEAEEHVWLYSGSIKSRQ
jgi:hypothetical protein